MANNDRLATELLAKIRRNQSLINDLEEKLNNNIHDLKKKVIRGKKGNPGRSQPVNNVVNQVVTVGMTGPKGENGDPGDKGEDGNVGATGPAGQNGTFNTANIFYGPKLEQEIIIEHDMILDADVYCSRLIVESGAKLRTDDFVIHVNGTLEIKPNATIHNDGDVGLKYSGIGGDVNCSGTSTEGMGGAGGSGQGCVNNGGQLKLNPSYIVPPELYYYNKEGEIRRRQFGAGGGGGLENGVGGHGAGSVIIFARKIINNGLISANGGASQDNCGGGGGGGYICLCYDEICGIGEIRVDGGLGYENGQNGVVVKYNNLVGDYEN